MGRRVRQGQQAGGMGEHKDPRGCQGAKAAPPQLSPASWDARWPSSQAGSSRAIQTGHVSASYLHHRDISSAPAQEQA